MKRGFQKLLGYVFCIIGIIILIINTLPLSTIYLKNSTSDSTTEIISEAKGEYGMLVGGIIIVIGIILIALAGKNNSNSRYIPVRHKGKIVEYQ
jgi:TRAP-type C4-dicarboxylate transport system permease small subunit